MSAEMRKTGAGSGSTNTISDDAAATIYLYIAASRVARIARIVGDATTATRLERMADEVRAAGLQLTKEELDEIRSVL